MRRPTPLTSVEGTTGLQEWALDPGKRHINHGSYGAVPHRTLAFQAQLRHELESNPLRWFDALPGRLAAERAALAPFVGAPVERLAVIPNASAGASVVFANLRLEPGEEVLATDHVYGSVLMGAERFAQRHGGRLRTVAIPLAADADETLERILAEVTDRTRMLVVDHISSATARGFPVEALIAATQHRNLVVVVDGAHAPGILEAPAAAVAEQERTAWFGNLHKFPSSPRAAAVLVASADLADGLYPLIDSWSMPLGYPERFDQQGSNDMTGFLSASYGIGEIDRLFGWQAVREHAATLTEYAVSIIAPELAKLQEAAPEIDLGMAQTAQRLLRLPPGVANDGVSARILKNSLSEEADIEAGIMPWLGNGYLRLSAHAYNTADDYEQFVERGIPVISRIAAAHSPAR